MSVIAFVLGTTAEAIKIKAVYQGLQNNGIQTTLWSTNQQAAELPKTLSVLNLDENIIGLSHRRTSLEKKFEAISWALECFRSINLIRKNRLIPDVICVQGDTMSTVIGAVAGKVLKVPVVHIEAGLRSGDWRNPFPEELNRILVSKIAKLHLAPDEIAVKNLHGSSGRVINTYGNTGIDALKAQLDSTQSLRSPADLPRCTVVLHRTELISRLDLFKATLLTLNKMSNLFEITMTIDVPSSAALQHIENSSEPVNIQFRVLPKLPFPEFVELLANTDLVVTDSGGLQEECCRLGLPCLVFREKSERVDGLGKNAVLTGLNPNNLFELAQNWRLLQREPSWPEISPSSISVDEILALLN